MGRGSLRNKLCECGSGKKYKNCCQGGLKVMTPGEYGHLNVSSFNHKMCFGTNVDSRECEGGIIKSHTIPKSGSLKEICNSSSEVYCFKPSVTNFDLNNYQKIEPVLDGIKQASTFRGFCGVHDNLLFEPLEKKPFGKTYEQCFLLAFRALAKEHHVRIGLRNSFKHDEAFSRALSGVYNKAFQETRDYLYFETALQINGFNVLRKRFESSFADKKFDSLCSLIIEFDAPLPVMCTGTDNPFWGFSNTELTKEEPNDSVLYYSSFASEHRGYFVLSWYSFSKVGKQFADSLCSLKVEMVIEKLIQYIFQAAENICISPDWWDNLSSSQRDFLLKCYTEGVISNNKKPAYSTDLFLDIPLEYTHSITLLG